MNITLFKQDSTPVEVVISLPLGWEKLPSKTFPNQPKNVEVLCFAPIPAEPASKDSHTPVVCVGFRRVYGVGLFLYPGYTTLHIAEDSPESDQLIGRAKPKHLPIDRDNQIIMQLY